MHVLTFHPLVDIPLVAVIACIFILNFRVWSNTADAELQPLLKSRLNSAILRITGFFGFILLFCWYLNIAAWGLLVLVIAIAFSGALAAGNAFGIDLAMLLAGGMLREWCFGFPQLVLRPQTTNVWEDELLTQRKLIGKSGVTTSPLRPAGNIEVDGIQFPAASECGTLIDVGQNIVVVDTRNNKLLVKHLS